LKKSFEKFSYGIIDYAGMFPPAKLPFAESFENFLLYRESNHRDFLARFVLPLDAFAPFCDAMSANPQPNHPVHITTLGGEKHKELTSVEEFSLELSYLKSLQESHPNDLVIDSYEVRLSVPMLSALAIDPNRDAAIGKLGKFGDDVVTSLQNRENDGLICFFELPYNGFTVAAPTFEMVTEVLSRINVSLNKLGVKARVGLKLRCGGERIPPSYLIAAILKQCIERKLPFKATQGLHHPYFSNSRDEKHGFISLFAAGIIACSNPQLTEEQLAEIVSEGKPEKFVFSDNELVWDGKYHATNQQIEEARHILISFGSCSFEEPLDDLKASGLL